MTQTLTAADQFTTAHGRLQSESHAPAWLHQRREAAFADFDRLGLPTVKDEDWKYTNLALIRETEFAPADQPGTLSDEQLAQWRIPDLDAAATFVFVDGLFDPGRSHIDDDLQGATVETLADAIASGRDVVEQYLGQLAPTEHDAFTALNTAFVQDGLVVHLPEGVTLDKPILLLNVGTNRDTPMASHPRTLIVAGADSRATVIEHYIGEPDAVYLTNAVTEIFAADRAVVHHYLLERESESAFQVSTLKIQQETESDVHSHTLLTGGRLVRNNIHPIINGPNSHCLINGLFVGRDQQHLDNAMRVEHAAPDCQSRQYYKGILNDKARGVFTGRIKVHHEGQRTDAVQTNQNMLLSDDAQAQARPQLEIFADDVKCTHGATTGQIDKDMVFYLQSRGIDKITAQALMVYAFAAENFERMELEPVRNLIQREMLNRLPRGDKLAEML